MPTGQTESVYKAEGRAAWAGGRGIEGNPYRWSTRPDECRQWAAGWAAARMDQRIQNRKVSRSTKGAGADGQRMAGRTPTG